MELIDEYAHPSATSSTAYVTLNSISCLFALLKTTPTKKELILYLKLF